MELEVPERWDTELRQLCREALAILKLEVLSLYIEGAVEDFMKTICEWPMMESVTCLYVTFASTLFCMPCQRTNKMIRDGLKAGRCGILKRKMMRSVYSGRGIQ